MTTFLDAGLDIRLGNHDVARKDLAAAFVKEIGLFLTTLGTVVQTMGQKNLSLS